MGSMFLRDLTERIGQGRSMGAALVRTCNAPFDELSLAYWGDESYDTTLLDPERHAFLQPAAPLHLLRTLLHLTSTLSEADFEEDIRLLNANIYSPSLTVATFNELSCDHSHIQTIRKHLNLHHWWLAAVQDQSASMVNDAWGTQVESFLPIDSQSLLGFPPKSDLLLQWWNQEDTAAWKNMCDTPQLSSTASQAAPAPHGQGTRPASLTVPAKWAGLGLGLSPKASGLLLQAFASHLAHGHSLGGALSRAVLQSFPTEVAGGSEWAKAHPIRHYFRAEGPTDLLMELWVLTTHLCSEEAPPQPSEPGAWDTLAFLRANLNMHNWWWASPTDPLPWPSPHADPDGFLDPQAAHGIARKPHVPKLAEDDEAFQAWKACREAPDLPGAHRGPMETLRPPGRP